jgi:hypothetical protein
MKNLPGASNTSIHGFILECIKFRTLDVGQKEM